MLENQTEANTHIINSYRELPQCRNANEVIQDLSENRVEAISKINEELSGTKFSWDYLSELALAKTTKTSFEAAFEAAFEKQKPAAVKTTDLNKITRNAVVLAKVKIIDFRKTKDNKNYLVVFLESCDPEEKIIGTAIIFDDKTITTVKADHEEIMLKVIPAKTAHGLPIARIYNS